MIDGDTFYLENGERVRLIGIDAPEYEPWKERVDFYGREAAVYAQKWLTGKKVTLEEDAEEKDKYGRTLAYVYLQDGTFVNLELVKQGYARAKYYRPNGKHYKILKDAEKEAKNFKKGVWH